MIRTSTFCLYSFLATLALLFIFINLTTKESSQSPAVALTPDEQYDLGHKLTGDDNHLNDLDDSHLLWFIQVRFGFKFIF